MNEVAKDRKLSTAELAAAGRPLRSEEELERREAKHPETTQEIKELPEKTGEAIPISAEGPPAAPLEETASAGPLFSREEADRMRADWDPIQIAFVDEPRRSVERADELVARAIQRLAEVFAQERSRLEEQWDRGDRVSTEDLRVALQRYRSFFERLLAV